MLKVIVIFACMMMMACAQGSFTCTDVSFWVEEGQFLFGDLSNGQTRNQDFHDKGFYTVTNDQKATSGCAGDTSYILMGNAPAHHTVTPVGYTPAVSAFALTSAGKFTFVNLPTIGTPEVWNGYTAFTFKATCSDVGSLPCEASAKINVLFTSASTHNSPKPSYSADYTNYVKCSGTCSTGMPWKARHTLPRLWDVMKTEDGVTIPQATVTWDADTLPTDGLDFEWSSNYALITTYGAIGNMGVRFPTMEVVAFTPGKFFEAGDFTSDVAPASTGFDMACLSSANQVRTGLGSDVWNYNGVALGAKYNSDASWYQKFGGKHDGCDVFTTRANACMYAPLLTPRESQVENDVGVWKLAIRGCTLRWQGKFTWNAMRNQKLSSSTNAQAWDIKKVTEGCLGVICTGFGGWQLTANMYNEAVQPNSWTEPKRGFAWIDHKYMLKIILNTDTDFKFELGIDIFTVDLQHFRYETVNGDKAFGYNMIVYPKTLNPLQQSAPDRRIQGFNWVENYWFAPNALMCPSCGTDGMVTDSTIAAGHCTNPEGAHSLYHGQFPAGSCNNAVVKLEKGPETVATTQCSSTDPLSAYLNRPGISPQDPCSTDFQNITLRGVATGSSGKADFGFEGRIVLTFLLENGEHPHFQIDPKMYVKSICIEGGFAGTSHTCRGSPKWPVANPILADLTDLPAYICEEVDARTFGPTDWAFIFFDIKDVDANLVKVKKLHISLSGVTVTFIDDAAPGNVNWTPTFNYLNFRNLKAIPAGKALLVTPTVPTGSAIGPQNTDFGFGFTPGAHNENVKITIYATLTILTTPSKNRRFAAAEEKDTDNTVQETININNRANKQSLSSSLSSSKSANNANASNSNSMTVTLLAVACALLVAAVIGMSVFIVKRGPLDTPKRVNSNV